MRKQLWAPLFLILLGIGFEFGGVEHAPARAQEAWVGPTLLTTNGVKSSNGATAVVLITVPSVNYRVYLGGVSIINRDTVTHTVSLISATSTRIMWQQDIPAATGVLLDNTMLLAADAGESVSLTSDAAGVSTQVKCTASAYAK